ncbi:MAG: hypothetical protein WCT26_00075 [Candidatus Buchananbacteria bacterium]|jgi:hypothetical protein
MSEAEKLFKQIMCTEELVARLDQQTQAAKERKRADLEALAVRIGAGESTGDIITDYLALHPSLMDKTNFSGGLVSKYLKDLYQEVSLHKGEPVFIIHRETRERSMKHYMSADDILSGSGLMMPLIPPLGPVPHYAVDFGILEDGRLYFNFESDTMYVYVKKMSSLESGGNIVSSNTDNEQDVVLPELQKLIYSLLHMITSECDWQVVVGLEAVKEWLPTCADFTMRLQLQDWLDKLDQPEAKQE